MAVTAALACASALLLATPSDVASQDDPRRDTVGQPSERERGWIGVSFGFDIRGGARATLGTILISDVRAGSPAEEAGLQPGDRVLAINELRTPRELAALPELLRLRAGDPVVMVVEREGHRRRYRLEAAPRPHFEASRSVRVSLTPDSLVETWSRSMDSLRLHLVTGDGSENVRVRRFGRDGTAIVADGSEHVVRVRPPFEFFVFQGEAHDSLEREMMEFNSLVVQLQERIHARERELRGIVDPGSRSRALGDSEIQRLRSELERVSARSYELESEMAEAARTTAEREYGLVVPETRAVEGGQGPRAAPAEFRPLTPYLLGRNRVAGAEVIDMKPELARHFQTSGGVLVVDVAEGTPAAVAGILPGDIVTRIGQVRIGSVEDLRFGVSAAEDTLPVTLTRGGESLRVLLIRR